MGKSILFVDDDKQLLKSIKRTFAGSMYDVYTAESGVEALELLSREPINLVVVDLEMPGMSGYAVLREVKEKYPSTIRLALSEDSDENTMMKIHKECLAKSYLFKPVKNQEVTDIIERTFNVEKMLENKELLEVINKIEVLPFSQSIFYKFNELIEKDASMKEIAETIESDPSLTAKVLQAANSVLYGIKTGSVGQAITYLGLNNVRNIVLMTIFYKKLDNHNNKQLIRDLETLWQHAVITNKIIPLLYRKLYKREMPEVCSMAGLLHDIGNVVVISTFTDEYIKAVEGVDPEKDLFYYYEEMSILPTSHSELGAYLLAWWGLPYPVVESALFHHNPFDERVFDRELVSLVHIAGIYSWNMIARDAKKEVDQNILDLFNLTPEDSCSLLKEIEEEVI